MEDWKQTQRESRNIPDDEVGEKSAVVVDDRQESIPLHGQVHRRYNWHSNPGTWQSRHAIVSAYMFVGNADVISRLTSRQVQFMAIGGTIGTGLFVGIGSALTRAGPLSLLLGYTITGAGVFGMV